jgi:hypothetical protein
MHCCRYHLAKYLYPIDGDYTKLDKDIPAIDILRNDAWRAKRRLEAIKKLVENMKSASDTKRKKRMLKLSNILPLFLKKKLFSQTKTTGLISPMRRVIARFKPIPIPIFLCFKELI